MARTVILVLALLAAAVSGCVQSSGTHTLNVNIGVHGSSSRTDTETHTWEQGSAPATLTWSKTGSGSAAVKVQDARGATLLERGITGQGEERLEQGERGDWTLTVQLRGFLGTLNLTLAAG